MSFRIIDDGKPHWYRRRKGDIALCVLRQSSSMACVIAEDASFYHIARSGRFLNGEGRDYDIVEHLPDCDGFDWKPSPKVIPWTFETSPVSVKVCSKSSSKKLLALCGQEGVCFLNMPNMPTYAEFLRDYVQLDGSPCGEVVS